MDFVLEKEEDYKVLLRMMEIFHALPDTPENDELNLLIGLITSYEGKTINSNLLV